ncbi:MAG: NADH-quinone oxidoreductase subunit NuoE [Deltaproteobacteria bacterium]
MPLPEDLRAQLENKIAASPHPRERVVDVLYSLQRHYGYLSDEAIREGAEICGRPPIELEELATFYDFIYREPVGRYVIHVCDGLVCWMDREFSVLDYLCRTLAIEPGGTSADGEFTVLPAACIGFCDHAPAMLINGEMYGPLDPQSIDRILADLRDKPRDAVLDR